jgi:Fusaric acid resistance protein family
VAPTTDWIRLQRRFPVTLVLVDSPPDLTLYMGADARTIIFQCRLRGPDERPEVNLTPYRTVASTIVAVWREFAEIEFCGARPAQASMPALVVAVSVGVACAMHLQEVWWAAISGFISSQATRPASVKKALLRVTGTMAGAALCLELVGWLAYDMFACVLALFVISSIGILGVNVSTHGYAWLFFSVTFCLVLLMSLVDPLNAFRFAINRTIEVVIGATVAIVIAFAMAPEESVAENSAPRGWTGLFDAQWPVVLRALRGALQSR